MISTKDVLDHHLKSFSEGDLTGILSDYAPEAVMITPPRMPTSVKVKALR